MSQSVRGSRTGRPIMRLLDVLGRRWSLRVLWELREQRLTFRELRSRCDNVSPTSLSQRLSDLRRANLVDHDEAGYGYTKWGRELAPFLAELNQWSQRWARSADRPGSRPTLAVTPKARAQRGSKKKRT